MKRRFIPKYTSDPLWKHMGNRNRKPSVQRTEAEIAADLGISPKLMEELKAEVEADENK